MKKTMITKTYQVLIYTFTLVVFLPQLLFSGSFCIDNNVRIPEFIGREYYKQHKIKNISKYSFIDDQKKYHEKIYVDEDGYCTGLYIYRIPVESTKQEFELYLRKAYQYDSLHRIKCFVCLTNTCDDLTWRSFDSTLYFYNALNQLEKDICFERMSEENPEPCKFITYYDYDENDSLIKSTRYYSPNNTIYWVKEYNYEGQGLKKHEKFYYIYYQDRPGFTDYIRSNTNNNLEIRSFNIDTILINIEYFEFDTLGLVITECSRKEKKEYFYNEDKNITKVLYYDQIKSDVMTKKDFEFELEKIQTIDYDKNGLIKQEQFCYIINDSTKCFGMIHYEYEFYE